MPSLYLRDSSWMCSSALDLEACDAFDLEVAVRAAGVEHRYAHARIAPQVLAFGAIVARVEDDVLAVRVDPHDTRLG